MKKGIFQLKPPCLIITSTRKILLPRCSDRRHNEMYSRTEKLSNLFWCWKNTTSLTQEIVDDYYCPLVCSSSEQTCCYPGTRNEKNTFFSNWRRKNTFFFMVEHQVITFGPIIWLCIIILYDDWLLDNLLERTFFQVGTKKILSPRGGSMPV